MLLRLLTTCCQHRLAAGSGVFSAAIRIPVPGSHPFGQIRLFRSAGFNNAATPATGPLGPRAYDVSTKVAKDVILFKYDNPRFFRVLNLFAVSQFLFWGYLTHFAYTTLKDASVPEAAHPDELAWYQKINLGENKYRNGIAIMSFFIGYGILFASWMFTLRSVRFLVLRKGGASVSVVTYGPFGKNRIMEVPVKCISAQESREAARVTIPIKIKNRSFFYVLDKRGEFSNSRLYDYTVGMRRNLD